ncbi:VOC family protein [Aquimarina sp. 2201CG5-10]|uniref:VOC family protein n=1 Tax=Aquimarina callyspongiae TaxID=3098150 RepID=UPI002AB53D5B|nr:VOC family protein [Aquimarina sp. 2201CG5-10]MDY8138234.1 VOC family protein [Aquimarina sp. 2201CG5-10]
MKYILGISVLLLISITGYSQDKNLSDLKPYFTAIVVSDIDVSIQWYEDKLGFKVRNKTEVEERGLKQANLQRADAIIELIQLKSSLSPKDILKEKPRGTFINGYFKFGFAVSDFDQWIKHLSESKAEFHGSVVKDPVSGKKMIIIKDPDGNRIQLFEN